MFVEGMPIPKLNAMKNNSGSELLLKNQKCQIIESLLNIFKYDLKKLKMFQFFLVKTQIKDMYNCRAL